MRLTAASRIAITTKILLVVLILSESSVVFPER
jgi:hypothetical protein